jgi:hypothetical protein
MQKVRNVIIFYGERLLDAGGTPLFGCPQLLIQLPSIAGGRFLHRQLQDVPCHGDKRPNVKDSFCEELEGAFSKIPKYHMKIVL